MKEIICIIQARMGSTRLPGKVLLPLGNKAIILHVVNRMLQSQKLTKIVVATTTKQKDDVLVRALTGYHDKVFVERGSENDVLDRYYQVAKNYHADIVVRAMGENPFVDPEVLDEIIGTLESNPELDYVSNSIGTHTFPRGLDVEAFTFSTLERCWKEGKEDMDREHVTVYVKRSPEKFNTKSYQNNVDLSGYRLTIDEPDDYVLAQALYDRLSTQKPPFRMKDIVEVFNLEPELAKINEHVKHKNPQY
jgi:spore coat polysaccharide biosynthesis protein SpsF (cytidylyltransferase family)